MPKNMLRLYDLFTSMQSSSRSFFCTLHRAKKSGRKGNGEKSQKPKSTIFIFKFEPCFNTHMFVGRLFIKLFYIFLAHFAVFLMNDHEKNPYTWSFL